MVSGSRSRTAWWRDGERERFEHTTLLETSPTQVDAPSSVQVFDGETARILELGTETINGMIETPSTWNSQNRTSPGSFIYQFQNVPYSELMDRAASFDVRKIELKDGAPGTQISFDHPDFVGRNFSFTLDNDRNIRQRVSEYVIEGPKNSMRLIELHEFSEYQEHLDPSGEKIFFPHRASIDFTLAFPVTTLVLSIQLNI